MGIARHSVGDGARFGHAGRVHHKGGGQCPPYEMKEADMDKRVAFVTGGSRGIGAAIVSRLAKDGLHVVAVARSLDKLEALCAQIKAEGGSAEALAVDIADPKALAAAI